MTVYLVNEDIQNELSLHIRNKVKTLFVCIFNFLLPLVVNKDVQMFIRLLATQTR